MHLVARTLLGAEVFADPERATKLWRWLNRPGRRNGGARCEPQPRGIVAACVMPNHVHSLEETDDARAARIRLARSLAWFGRLIGVFPLWAPLPPAQVVPDRLHLLRQIRYVHLNPCRAGLVDDPLRWPWSTHRALIGAAMNPVVDAARVARLVQYGARDFASWFHAYVSGDPTAAVAGTPMPVPAETRVVAAVPLADVISAARAATADSPRRVDFHRLAVALAYDQGWRDNEVIALTLGVGVRHVRRLASAPAPNSLRLGRLYLGDERLRALPGTTHGAPRRFLARVRTAQEERGGRGGPLPPLPASGSRSIRPDIICPRPAVDGGIG